MNIEFPNGSFSNSGYNVEKVKNMFYDDLNTKLSVFADKNNDNDNYFQKFDNIIDRIIAFLVTPNSVSNDLDDAISKFIDSVHFRSYVPSMTGRMIIDGTVKQFVISYYMLVGLSALKKENFQPVVNLEKEKKITSRELDNTFRIMQRKAFRFIQKNYDCNKSYTVREIFDLCGFTLPNTNGLKEAEDILNSIFSPYSTSTTETTVSKIQRFISSLADLTSNTEIYSSFKNYTKMPDSMVPDFTRQAVDYSSASLYNCNMAFLQTYHFVYSCWDKLRSIRHVMQKHNEKNGNEDKKITYGVRKETKLNMTFDLFFNNITVAVHKFHNRCVPNIRKLKKELNSKTHKEFLCETVFTSPNLSTLALNKILDVNYRLLENVDNELTRSVLAYHCKTIEKLLLSINYCDQIMTHFVTIWGGVNRCIPLGQTKSRLSLPMSKIMQVYLGKDVLVSRCNTYTTTKFFDRTKDQYMDTPKPIIDEFETLLNKIVTRIEIDLNDWEILGVRMVARSIDFLVKQHVPLTKGGEIGKSNIYNECIKLGSDDIYDAFNVFASLANRYRFITVKESSLFNEKIMSIISQTIHALEETKLKDMGYIPTNMLTTKVYFDTLCNIAFDESQINPDILALEKELENDQFFNTLQKFGCLYNMYTLPLNATGRNRFPGSVFNFNSSHSDAYESFVKIIHSNR